MTTDITYSPDVEIPLRDGTTTHDPRLDRLIKFDPRSRNFPIREAAGSKVPRSYTWRVPSGMVLDQGREGACVGFGWAYELAANPIMVQGVTNDFAKARIYWPAQRIDEWQGGAYPGATPFYEGTSVLAGAKIVQEMGHVGEYRWAFGIEDLVIGLGRNGPAVLGIWWREGMYNTDAGGFINYTGGYGGGHCVIANRIKAVFLPGREKSWSTLDREKSFIEGMNSWGGDWGVGGKWKMTVEHMGAALAEQGEACFPQRRKRVAI